MGSGLLLYNIWYIVADHATFFTKILKIINIWPQLKPNEFNKHRDMREKRFHAPVSC